MTMQNPLMKGIDYFLAYSVITTIFILRSLPSAVTIRIGKCLGCIAGLAGVRKQLILKNLGIAFPEKSDSELKIMRKEIYLRFGEFLGLWLSFQRLGDKKIRALVDMENVELVHRALERGKGLFCVAAHFGNWELAGRILPQVCPDFHLVLKRLKNKRLNDYFEKLHLESGLKSIYSKKSAVQLVKCMLKNKTVGILMDQNAGMRGVFVPFFGRRTSFHRGPAQIALRTGAAIVTLFVIPAGNRWRIVFDEINTGSTGDLEADTMRIMSEYAAQLESHIRKHPTYYFWFHNRWKVDPPGEKPLDT
jgi:Kdo2-lipid IVA lauroyltransferase/acyltransferase